jgi:hypothetical protein
MSRASWLGNFAQWGSVAIAVIALGASATTAYFALLRKTEELRIVVDTWPKHDVDLDSGRLFIESEPIGVSFINSGNRPFIILGSEVIIVEDTGPYSQPSTCKGSTQRTSLRPFVIKENEIIHKEVSVLGIDPYKRKIFFPNQIQLNPEGGESYRATMCVSFHAASPTEREIKAVVEGHTIFRWEGGKGGQSIIVANSPWVVWRRAGSLLD